MRSEVVSDDDVRGIVSEVVSANDVGGRDEGRFGTDVIVAIHNVTTVGCKNAHFVPVCSACSIAGGTEQKSPNLPILAPPCAGGVV